MESFIQDLRKSIPLCGYRTSYLSNVVLLEGLNLASCDFPSVFFGTVDRLVRGFVFVELLMLLLVVLLWGWGSLHQDLGQVFGVGVGRGRDFSRDLESGVVVFVEEGQLKDLFRVVGVGADASTKGTDGSHRAQRKTTNGVLRMRSMNGPKGSIPLSLSKNRSLSIFEIPMMPLPPLSLKHNMTRCQHQMLFLPSTHHPTMLNLPQFSSLRDTHMNRLPKQNLTHLVYYKNYHHIEKNYHIKLPSQTSKTNNSSRYISIKQQKEPSKISSASVMLCQIFPFKKSRHQKITQRSPQVFQSLRFIECSLPRSCFRNIRMLKLIFSGFSLGLQRHRQAISCAFLMPLPKQIKVLCLKKGRQTMMLSPFSYTTSPGTNMQPLSARKKANLIGLRNLRVRRWQQEHLKVGLQGSADRNLDRILRLDCWIDGRWGKQAEISENEPAVMSLLMMRRQLKQINLLV